MIGSDALKAYLKSVERPILSAMEIGVEGLSGDEKVMEMSLEAFLFDVIPASRVSKGDVLYTAIRALLQANDFLFDRFEPLQTLTLHCFGREGLSRHF